MPFFEAPLHEVGLAASALADMGWQLAGTSACAGDCDAGGSVAINEVITAVRIALGESGGAICAAADANGDGVVTISELIAAVARALDGCAAG